MRTYLYADQEIFENDDAVAMQSGPALDVSALLAAWCGSASDTGITSGADPQAVLAGLDVSVSGTTVTIAPGSLAFVIADTDGVSWQVGTSRATSTLTTALAAAGKHRKVIVEALVSQVTINATRNFKRLLGSRVVIQAESTPKIRNAVVTFRLRDGTEDLLASDVRLPAWDSFVLPLAMLEVTDTTVTATDIRRMVRPGRQGLTFGQPVNARTGVGVRNLALDRNVVGFGAQTAMDYCDITQINALFPNPPGVAILVDSGYVPAATNSVGYVYACRVHPKVGAVSYVLSSKVPTVDRNMTVAAVTLPAPWPSATTAAASECKYVCPMFYGSAQSTALTHGTRHVIEANRPSVTQLGVVSGDVFTLDYATIVPPTAISAVVDFKIKFTVAAYAPTYVNLSVGVGAPPATPPSAGTLTGEESTMNSTAAGSPTVDYIFIRNVRVNFYHNAGGVKHDTYLEILGANVAPANVTAYVNEVTEMLRQ